MKYDLQPDTNFWNRFVVNVELLSSMLLSLLSFFIETPQGVKRGTFILGGTFSKKLQGVAWGTFILGGTFLKYLCEA